MERKKMKSNFQLFETILIPFQFHSSGFFFHKERPLEMMMEEIQ